MALSPTGRYRINVTGAQGAVTPSLQALADQAEQAADSVSALSPQIVPQVTATVSQNNQTKTIYTVTVPDGFDATINGRRFSFVVPENSVSSSVALVVNSVERDVFMVNSQPLRAGWVVTFSSNNGGNKWNLETQVPNSLSMLSVERSADASSKTLPQIIGADAVAEPIDGNPNRVYVDFDSWVNDQHHYFYMRETNTGDVTIIYRDGRQALVYGAFPGFMKAGEIADVQVSYGIQNLYFRGSAPLKPLAEVRGIEEDLIAKFVRDFHAAQWAASGSQPVPFAITSAGSSVTTEISSGRDGATDYAPSHRLVDLLNGYTGTPTGIPTGARVPGTKAIDDNWSRGRQAISQFFSQIFESPYWQAGTTRALFVSPGPNDWRVGGYNAGQTFPAGIQIIEEIIVEGKKRGIPTFLTTAFDPDVSQEDYASFFTSNQGIGQSYPYAAAAPVNPNTQQYPPANNSSGTADMTGHGVPIPFDRRFEHGASAVRALAARYPECVVVIDSRKAYHRAVEALQPNAYQKRILYGEGDPIHPLRYAHDRGFGVPMLELAQDIVAGRTLKRVYEGSDTANYGA